MRLPRLRSNSCLYVLPLLALTACDKATLPGESAEIPAVSLSHDEIVLGPGRCTADVEASFTPAGEMQPFRWEIQDTNVARVETQAGGTAGFYQLRANVGARAEGATWLRVSRTSGSETFSRSIPVRVEAMPPSTVFFRSGHLLVSLVVGDSVVVGPGVASGCGALEGVPTVRTENPEVADVDSRFVVRARKVGRTTLTGTFGPALGSAPINVQDYLLTPSEATVREGDTLAVQPFWVRDTGTTAEGSVNLISSDTSVARVLPAGSAGTLRYVVARRAGTVDLLIGKYRRGQVRVVPR